MRGHAGSSRLFSLQLFVPNRRSFCCTETGHHSTSPEKPTLDSSKLNSFRPISNLSFISKLVECVAPNRFVCHAEGNALFPVHQSSYRQNHSTDTAMLCIHKSIVCAVDQKLIHVVAIVLLDLSAAFDTVDQATLYSVLQRRFGDCDTALAWLQSYCSDEGLKRQRGCLSRCWVLGYAASGG